MSGPVLAPTPPRKVYIALKRDLSTLALAVASCAALGAMQGVLEASPPDTPSLKHLWTVARNLEDALEKAGYLPPKVPQ